MKKRSGFTLVELLIVMAVLAILVGIAVPAFQGMREQGNVARSQGDLRTIQNALESYYGTNNAYPPAATYQADLLAATPKILSSTKNDPFAAANTQYAYFTSPNSKYYVCFSIGKDVAATITGVSDAGVVAPANKADDVWVSNGS